MRAARVLASAFYSIEVSLPESQVPASETIP
jgi:hypothetical protein